MQTHPMSLDDVTEKQLRMTFSKQRTDSACGMGGWRVAELNALPPILLAKLADILKVADSTGKWPKSLERALISLIPKGKGERHWRCGLSP